MVCLLLGCQLCMGHAVDQNLLSLVQQDIRDVAEKIKKTKGAQLAIQESLAQLKTEQPEMQKTVASIQDQQSSTGVQLKAHGEQLKAVLEWKEQQMNENKEILEKLMFVEKTLSEELLIRVQGMQKGLSYTDDRVEQLEQRFVKTDDKVEQLEQGFAKTDDKVEQLEQGFGKTDGKVEQMKHGFVRVEKDVSKMSYKVKQLEHELKSQRMKGNKSG